MKTAEPSGATPTAQVQRKTSTPFAKKGEGAFFGRNEQQAFFDPVHTVTNTGAVQAKLSVGEPGDAYETEADAMADKVVQRLHEPGTIPQQQAPVGNVTPLVQRKCAECEREEQLQKKEEDTAPETIQRKCAACSDEISPQQAEAHQVQRKAVFEAEPSAAAETVQRKCAACEQEEQLQKKEEDSEPEQESLQRKPVFESNAVPPDDDPPVSPKRRLNRKEDRTAVKNAESQAVENTGALENRLATSRGQGEPLPLDTRSRMEQSFGADFSAVRIHNDSTAAQLSQELNAQAFTTGNDIYFNTGKYDTTTETGQHLLAHELTHTIQQGAVETGTAVQQKTVVQRSWLGDAWDATGGRVVSGIQNAGEAIADTGMAALSALVNRLAPGLLSFLQGDIIETIKQRLIAAIDTLTGGLFSRIQAQGLLSVLMQLLGAGISSVGQGIAGGCSAMAEAARMLWAFVKKLTGPAIQAFKTFMSKIGSFLSSAWTQFGQPAWEAIKHYAGETWNWLVQKATWLWNLTEPVRHAIGEAWDWVKRQFNIAWTEAGSVLEWLKQKASSAWNWVKARIEPLIGPLKAIAAVAVLLSPAGPILAVYYGAPYVWTAIKWLAENFNKYVILRAKAYLRNTILPFIQSGITTIQSYVQIGLNWLQGAFTRLGNIATQLLNAVAQLAPFRLLQAGVQAIAEAVNTAVTFVAAKAAALAVWVRTTAQRIWTYLRPVAEILRNLLMIGVLGPYAILDDGVWNMLVSIVRFSLTVPCLRELEGLLMVPFWVEQISRMRQAIKDAWFMITHPEVMEAKARAFLEPYIKQIPGKAESALTNALARVGLASSKHLAGILRYLVPSVKHLVANWWPEVKKMLWYLIWPFAEGSPLYTDTPKLWQLVPRIWNNLWSGNFAMARDGFLEWMQALNTVLGLFAGWIAIGGALIGAIVGAVGGAGVGAIPGAGAGFEIGLQIGEGLMIAMIATETAVILAAVYDLATVTDDGKTTPAATAPAAPAEAHEGEGAAALDAPRQYTSGDVHTAHERIEYAYQRIANSAITLGIMGALLLLGAVGGEIAEALMSLAKKAGDVLAKAFPRVAELAGDAGRALGESRIVKGLREAGSEFRKGRDMVRGRSGPIPEDSPATEGINNDITTLEERVNNPENIRGVTDPEFSGEYDVEVEVGEHRFRRRRDNHSWCRFSEPYCGIGLDDVNAKVDNALKGNMLDESGVFKDAQLEARYQEYVRRKLAARETPRNRLDWKQASDFWLNDSPMARGNAFNKKAVTENWYDYHEVNLDNGKRLDSYDPVNGEIVSRKATDLAEIDISTFESYLDELKTKYRKGTRIRSDKYPDIDGQRLQGRYILEIPESNRNFAQINDYIRIAKRKGIEIRFKPE